MMISLSKTQRLLKNNNIIAAVMTRWNRNNNPNCKFVPGDKVIVKSKKNIWESIRNRKLSGSRGVIVGVTTASNNRMTSETSHSTSYYVAIGADYVGRFMSNSLEVV